MQCVLSYFSLSTQNVFDSFAWRYNYEKWKYNRCAKITEIEFLVLVLYWLVVSDLEKMYPRVEKDCSYPSENICFKSVPNWTELNWTKLRLRRLKLLKVISVRFIVPNTQWQLITSAWRHQVSASLLLVLGCAISCRWLADGCWPHLAVA